MSHNTARLLGLLVIAACIVACGGSAVRTPSRPTGVTYSSVNVAGTERTYRLYVPSALDQTKPAPLIVTLAAATLNGGGMAAYTNFDEEAAVGGFIAVYPDPVGGFWNAGLCCGDAARTGVDDVGFINSLLDRLTGSYRIDKARIFSTGLSAGALMTYRLACDLSGRIVAIASVAGVMTTSECRPNRPVSILEIHGTADALVPYAGGKNPDPEDDLKVLFSSAAVVQTWARLNGCPGTASQTVVGITKISTWTACLGGTAVRLETVVGGHHTWFGSSLPSAGGDPTDFDAVPGEPSASAVLWDFFSHLAPRA